MSGFLLFGQCAENNKWMLVAVPLKSGCTFLLVRWCCGGRRWRVSCLLVSKRLSVENVIVIEVYNRE